MSLEIWVIILYHISIRDRPRGKYKPRSSNLIFLDYWNEAFIINLYNYMDNKNLKNLEKIRHSFAHVLMHALKRLYGAIPGVGPNIDDGFYHDFDADYQVTLDDLPKIEKEMKKIIKENIKIEKKVMSIKDGLAWLKEQGYKYTEELAMDLKKEGEKEISFYMQGDFGNMCKGPHVESTKKLKAYAFKLTKVAGAYWRGDEKNKMIQRVYGVAFENKDELNNYLKAKVEAEKRDHRKLGKELDLFVFSDLVGKGLPLLTPKGSVIRQELERFIVDEETKRGYLRTYTPDIAKVGLYKKSGHWDHYKEDMYPKIDIDGEEYVLRPMTCPHQFMIYNSRPRSYRELPLRYAEIAKLYRREQSGELSGLMRVMCFSLVDAHIICREDQLEKEFEEVVDLVQYGMEVLGIKDYWYRFSKGDLNNKEKYIDNPKAWKESESSMKKILDKMKLEYVEAEGEAAFYGPKLDVQMRNVNGKEDTAFTVQIDFALPERFDMTYINKDGKEQRPMIIHRSSIGCIERTMAFLIEQYAGAFPVWLSPAQVKIVAVSEKHVEYCEKQAEEFRSHDIRVEVDYSDETVGNKIRKAVKEKVPYILVIGDKEIKSTKLAVRDRGSDKVREVGKQEFIKEIKDRIKNRD